MCPGHPRIPPPSIPAQPGQIQQPTFEEIRSIESSVVSHPHPLRPFAFCSRRRHRVGSPSVLPFSRSSQGPFGSDARVCRILVRGVVGTDGVMQQRAFERPRQKTRFVCEMQGGRNSNPRWGMSEINEKRGVESGLWAK